MRLDFSSDPEFGRESWRAWREVLSRVTPQTRELWAICGRGSGKTRIASRIALEHALREWPHAPGERVYVAVIAPSREQSTIALNYIKAGLPPEMIERETRECIDLVNSNSILVVTASTAAPRGRSYSAVICDELSFFAVEDAADPDTAILTAVRPGLARVAGSMLVCISSPWGRRGETYRAAQRWGQTGGDEHHVFAQAATRELNPTFDQAEIDRAFAEDSASASCEYGATFRSDVEQFLSRELIDAAVERRAELPYQDGVSYRAFVDPSGGSQDSFTLAIAHAENTMVVIDALVEARPPFDPDEVTQRMAEVIKRYGLSRVTGDKYAGEWPRSRFRAHDVHYVCAEPTATQYYAATLPLFTSGRIRMPNNARCVAQLAGLERTVGRSGRETISHPPGGHDDLANAVAGAAVEAGDRSAGTVQQVKAVWWGTAEREQPDGVDFRGRAWKDNRPWTGVFPEMTQFDLKGRALEQPPKFFEGQRVELTAGEQDYYRSNPPKAPKQMRVLWG